MADALYPVLALNLLVVLAAWCLARPSRRAAAALVALALVWVLVNGPLEGRVLWTVTPGHGLTEADLLSVAAAAIAVHTWRRLNFSRIR